MQVCVECVCVCVHKCLCMLVSVRVCKGAERHSGKALGTGTR